MLMTDYQDHWPVCLFSLPVFVWREVVLIWLYSFWDFKDLSLPLDVHYFEKTNIATVLS